MFTSVKFQLLRLLFDQQRVDERTRTTQGLTLIELLIVVVIIGILSAIASSSFIGAATRAKGTEAKTNLSAILRAQQQHYIEHSEFAHALDDLALGVNAITTHYSYRVTRGGNDRDIDGNSITEFAIAIAIPQTEVRGYMGKVWLDSFNGDPNPKTVLCEGEIGETYFMNGKTYCP